MAKLYNLARVTTATVGTGTITLGSAVSGFLTFALAGVANGDTVSYGISDGSNSEVGIGVYTSAGTSLTRTPMFSTNGNALISLSGAAQVFITARAQDFGALPGYLFGLTLSTAGSSTAFGIAAGQATDSATVDAMVLGSAYTKTTASWAVGSGNGALDTGSTGGSASTWYHVYLIKRLDTGVVDVLFSLSASSPTMPANYTLFRRIGSMKTDGSKNWTLFKQVGDEFLWSVPVTDVNTAALSTTPTLFVLSTPLGIQTIAFIRGYLTAGTAILALVNSPDEASCAINTPNGNNTAFAGSGTVNPFVTTVRTDTSSQVRAVAQSASTGFVIATFGWFDRRGRDA